MLGLTFTRKAAGELAERVRRRLRRLAAVGAGARTWATADGDADISTYHAFAGRLVREHALRLGVEPESRLLTEAASWQYAREVVERWAGDMSEVGQQPRRPIVDAVLRLSGECAEHLVEPADLLGYLDQLEDRIAALPGGDRQGTAPAGRSRTLLKRRHRCAAARACRCCAAYAERKRAREALDFGDQLALAARLARDFPDIGRAERARTRTVLLDEFQDTSHAQLVMLRELFGGGPLGDGRRRPAPVDLRLARRERRHAGPVRRASSPPADGTPARQLTLSTSWRNDRAVLAVANVVAAPLRAAERSGRPARGAVAGGAAGRRARAGAGRALAHHGRRGRGRRRPGSAERWRRAGRGRHGGGAVPDAVPVRRRSRPRCGRPGCRSRSSASAACSARPEVVDVVAALQVVADPDRGDALMRLLAGPLVPARAPRPAGARPVGQGRRGQQMLA